MKENTLKLLLFILFSLLCGILILAVFTLPTKASAKMCKAEHAECQINESDHPCCFALSCVPFNIHSGNGKCEPLPTETPTPTLKPTLTPTPTIIAPCEEDCDENDHPTPTPTMVSPTPMQGIQIQVSSNGGDGRSDGGKSSGNVWNDPSCTIAFDAPILTGFLRNSYNSVTFSWWKSTDGNVDRQSIVYGYEEGNPLFGIVDITKDATSITLNGLEHRNIWAQVWAWKGSCVAKSNWLDP